MTKKAKEIPKVWNSMNYQFKAKSGKTYNKVSSTIPDMTMSLREILIKHTRGDRIFGNASEALYTGEDGEGIDFDHLDLAEKEEHILAAKQELKKLTEILTQQKQQIKIDKIEEEQKRVALINEEKIAAAKKAEEEESE